MAIKIRYRPAVVSYIAGERCVSSEYQVVDGRKVVSRHDLEEQAQRAVAELALRNPETTGESGV